MFDEDTSFVGLQSTSPTEASFLLSGFLPRVCSIPSRPDLPFVFTILRTWVRNHITCTKQKWSTRSTYVLGVHQLLFTTCSIVRHYLSFVLCVEFSYLFRDWGDRFPTSGQKQDNSAPKVLFGSKPSVILAGCKDLASGIRVG